MSKIELKFTVETDVPEGDLSDVAEAALAEHGTVVEVSHSVVTTKYLVRGVQDGQAVGVVVEAESQAEAQTLAEQDGQVVVDVTDITARPDLNPRTDESS